MIAQLQQATENICYTYIHLPFILSAQLQVDPTPKDKIILILNSLYIVFVNSSPSKEVMSNSAQYSTGYAVLC